MPSSLRCKSDGIFSSPFFSCRKKADELDSEGCRLPNIICSTIHFISFTQSAYFIQHFKMLGTICSRFSNCEHHEISFSPRYYSELNEVGFLISTLWSLRGTFIALTVVMTFIIKATVKISVDITISVSERLCLIAFRPG